MKYALASLGEEPYPRYVELMRQCELLEYDGVCRTDTKWTRDTFVSASAAAVVTKDVEINLTTLDPYARHPAITAQACASLAELSGGRLRVMMGMGSHFETMPGYEPARPLTGIREAVEIMRRLWAGESVHLEGEVIRLRGAEFDFDLDPAYVPQVWLASRGPKILELAGEIGDGAMVGSFSTPGGITYAKKNISRGLEKSNRGFDQFPLGSWLYVCFLESEDDPIPESVKRGISHGVWSSRAAIPAVMEEIGVEPTREFLEFLESDASGWSADVMAELRNVIPRSVVDALAVVGTGPQVVDKFRGLADAGVDEFMIWPSLRDGQTIENFATQFAYEVIYPTRGPRRRDVYRMIH